MFNYLKNRRKNKKIGIQKVYKPYQSFSSLITNIPIIVTGATGLSSAISGGSLSIFMFFAGATGGASARLIIGLDNLAVGHHIRGETNAFTRLIYKTFLKTPLRFYTVNRISKRLEEIEGRSKSEIIFHAQKSAKLKNDDVRIATSRIDDQTIRYIKKTTDSRKHLHYLIGIAMVGFAAIRMISGPPSANKVITPTQWASRLASLATTVAVSAFHIHAYIKKRAAEKEPRPFFVIAAHWAERFPTKFVAHWLIKWDAQKITDIEAGRQVWTHRLVEKMFDKIPVPFVRNFCQKKLRETRLNLSDKVKRQLAEDGIDDRVESLKGLAKKELTHLNDVTLRSAYNDLMLRTQAQLAETEVSFRCYKKKTEDRNDAREQLYNIFNSKRDVPMTLPLVDQSHTLYVEKPAAPTKFWKCEQPIFHGK